MLWKGFKFLTLLALNYFAVLTIMARAQEQPVGYVLVVEGDWRLNGKNGITKGSTVRPHDKITANSESNGKIIIALYDRTTLSQVCPSTECKTPITIPFITKPDDATKLLLEVLFLDEVNLLIDTSSITRGPGDRELPDAVISNANGKLNLAPLLRGFDGETCKLIFVPIENNGSPTKSSKIEKNVDVPNPLGSSLFVSIPGLQQGLYQVSTPKTSKAWVLIAPEDKYSGLAEKMQQANDRIVGWGAGNQVSLEDQSAFIKKHLYRLAYPKSTSP